MSNFFIKLSNKFSFLDKILSQNKRTNKAQKNIIASFLLKGLLTIIELLIVPLSLSYLTKTDYGIWLTIYSMVMWLNFFDAGLSHGFRNKLSKALADNDFNLARVYTSTAYGIISIITIFSTTIFLLVFPFITWYKVLNASPSQESLIKNIVLVVFVSFALNLLLKTISAIFLAKQMSYLNDWFNFLSKFIIIIVLIFLTFDSNKSLLIYSIVFSLIPIMVLLLASIVLFSKSYYHLRPSFKYFSKTKIKDIMSLGVKFFVIQISMTIIFMTDNIIISHIFDPSYVTPYQVTHKYFGVGLIFYSIIISPFWSATTEAYHKQDFGWIKRSIRSLTKLWIFTVLIILIMLWCYKPVLKLWVGEDIKVSFFLALNWAIFTIVQTLNMIYTHFLNGTGKLLIQIITVLFAAIVNIPLSIFFAKYLNMGTPGVLLATNLSVILFIFLRKIQYHKIITNNAYGIWNR